MVPRRDGVINTFKYLPIGFNRFSLDSTHKIGKRMEEMVDLIVSSHLTDSLEDVMLS